MLRQAHASAGSARENRNFHPNVRRRLFFIEIIQTKTTGD
jgi:hypothetical protein